MIILNTNDWELYRPKLIVMEGTYENDDIKNKFFERIGYHKIIDTFHFGRLLNSIYRDNRIDTM